MTDQTTQSVPTPPSRPGFPLGAVIGIAVLALVGVAMLGFALISLIDQSPPPPPTQPIAQLPTTAPTVPIVIPTATAPPPATPTEAAPPTVAPTDTQAAPAPATTTAPTTPVLTINVPANVRSGPGINYPVIGGLSVGATAEVVGRDASATWYVINYQGGQGWVSNQVAQYSGDTNALPVIAAPPTPRPIATPVPPTPTPRPAATATGVAGGIGGIRVDYFYLTNNITQVSAGTPFQFRFKITNLTGQPLHFGGMGAIALPGGPAQPSWSTVTDGKPIPIGGELEWEDNMVITQPGTYKIHLGICPQGTQSSCENPAGWQVLSAGITLVVN
ncbi:MAG: SH3 domain-containing protein [Anaerolineales bacterium]|nr:SH3 domain-containing protein [Anaerolineales bacterium]MDW8325505.1 SH3 domain-containing protein [Anaerolineales bacterium]